MSIEIKQNYPFKNLCLDSNVLLDEEISVIMGKNGSGKTRLLEGIQQNLIQVFIDGQAVSYQQQVFYNMENLRPALSFGYDKVHYHEELKNVVSFYQSHKKEFLLDRVAFEKSAARVEISSIMNMLALYDTVWRIVDKKGVQADEINPSDIYAYYTNINDSLGSQNVTATFLQYLDRLEENEANIALNKQNGYSLPELTEEEFNELYGPPPWKVFNSILSDILDNTYYVQPPKYRSYEAYSAKLLRVKDNVEIQQEVLSSGEKVLLWLAISVYNTAIFTSKSVKPKLILLDEPDAFLHPQMIEKMYMTFEKIINNYRCKIIITTHSPTTIALFRGQGIYKMSETKLEKIEKDIAISELLDGVPQVSISYKNRRQIYVESHNDASLYQEIFDELKLRKKVKPYISLTFISTGNKLPEELILSKIKKVFGDIDSGQVSDFVNQLLGVGNCDQVIGTVESLEKGGNNTVGGIIDWDLKNQDKGSVYVSSPGLFYNIECVILNPLTLGIYLLNNYRNKIRPADLGICDDYNLKELYSDQNTCQIIADRLTKYILNTEHSPDKVTCRFTNGIKVDFVKEYVHMKGHKLEAKVKEKYPFLKEHNKNDLSLKLDVMRKTMLWDSHCDNIPQSLIDLFAKLQS